MISFLNIENGVNEKLCLRLSLNSVEVGKIMLTVEKINNYSFKNIRTVQGDSAFLASV